MYLPVLLFMEKQKKVVPPGRSRTKKHKGYTSWRSTRSSVIASDVRVRIPTEKGLHWGHVHP